MDQKDPLTTAYIALGSNLGDPVSVLKAALISLGRFSSQPMRVSSFYRTQPVDCPPDSPSFINAVAEISVASHTTPEEFLSVLKGLEISFGRQPKTVHNAPRILDLDLISFGSEVRDSENLILPHPRAHQRAFVLAPLSELNPELVLLGQSSSVKSLLEGARDRDSVKIME